MFTNSVCKNFRIYVFSKLRGRGEFMKKLLKKVIESYAKNSTNSCWVWSFHQNRAPKCLIQK